jgi:hypothetical protein
MNWLLRGCINVGLVALMAALSGCGSRHVAETKSAQKEIAESEQLVDSARGWEKKGQLDLAIGDYNRAKDVIFAAKSFAGGTELSKLNNMDEDVRKRLTDLKTRKLTVTPEPEKKAPVAVVSTEDPGEKAKKEAEAKKAEQQKKAAADAKALTDSFTTANASATKPKDNKDEEEAPATKGAAKPGDKAAAPGDKVVDGDAADDKGPPAIKPADGPFPAITEKSPPLDICKLANKGNYVIAYAQIYNKAQAGKRIMGVSVFFKDANNQPIIAPQATATFQYSGFKADIKDPFDQSIPTITLGSHAVGGFEGLRIACVGETPRSGDVKKVSIKVVYDDNTNVVETGPANAAAIDTVKGVKLK